MKITNMKIKVIRPYDTVRTLPETRGNGTVKARGSPDDRLQDAFDF